MGYTEQCLIDFSGYYIGRIKHWAEQVFIDKVLNGSKAWYRVALLNRACQLRWFLSERDTTGAEEVICCSSRGHGSMLLAGHPQSRPELGSLHSKPASKGKYPASDRVEISCIYPPDARRGSLCVWRTGVSTIRVGCAAPLSI